MTSNTLPPLPRACGHEQARPYLDLCLQHMAEQPGTQCWTLDASALTQFDSSVVAVLLGVARAAHEQGATLQIESWPQSLADLSTLYGVHELLAA